MLDVYIGAKMGEQIANEHADLTCRRYEQTLRTDVTYRRDRQTNFILYNIDLALNTITWEIFSILESILGI